MPTPVLFTFILMLLSVNSFAQSAASSMFGEVRSRNPAVISHRPYGQFTGAVSVDSITKSQELDATKGSVFTGESESEVTLNTISFFRGGKGGGATYEFNLDVANGELTDTVNNDSGESTTAESSASLINIYYGLGFGKNFGIGLQYVGYEYTQQYDVSIGGSDYSGDFAANITGLLVKLGWRGGLGPLQLGLFSEIGHSSTEINSVKEGGVAPTDDEGQNGAIMNLGFGLGFRTRSTHFEIGYEMPMAQGDEGEDEVLGGSDDPMFRASVILAFTYKRLILGYTGTLYSGGYQDIQDMAYNQLVYSTQDSRLKHEVNFSFGGGSGLSLGGAVFVSSAETEELTPLVGTEMEDTTIKSSGASVKVNYVF